MSKLQPLRGNPEAKISSIFTDFSGGINVVESDDDVKPDQLRFATNVDIDDEGNLKNRKGWIKHTALTEVLSGLPPITNTKGFCYGKNISYGIERDTLVPSSLNSLEPGDTLLVTLGQSYQGGIDGNDYLLVYLQGLGSVYFYQGDIEKELVVPNEQPLYDVDKVFVSSSQDYYDGMNYMVITIKEEFESLIKGDPIEYLGLYVIKDRYSQMAGLMTSKTKEDFINQFSVDEDLVYYDAGFIRFRDNSPLILLLVYRNYEGNVIGAPVFVYNTYDAYHVEYGERTRLSSESHGKIRNYREGLIRSISNVSSGVFKGNLFITIPGSNELYEVLDEFTPTELPTGEQVLSLVIEGSGGDDDNKAYKPTPMEVRRVGFNMLGTNPIKWVDNPETTLKAINGVFITNYDAEPIQYIPSDNEFQINAMVSGNPNNVTLKIWEYVDGERVEVPISFNRINNFPIVAFEGRMLANPTTEVEIEITIPDTPPIVFRDYYPIGDLTNTTPMNLEGFDPGDYSTTTIEGRLVLYGNNIIWWSDFKEPTYIPNYNYVRLPFSPEQDEIVNITFFRSSYIIFTRKSIYKLKGAFNPSEMDVSLVTGHVGCVAPKSVKMIDNQLIFLSNRGLYSLKSETFREDMENVQPLDTKIAPLFEQNVFNASIAFVTDEEYILFLNYENSYSIKTGLRVFSAGRRSYEVPDIVRYYYDRDAVVFDYFPDYDRPGFLMEFDKVLVVYKSKQSSNGITDNFVYTRQEGATDFDKPFLVSFETAGVSMGYPAHEKKVKKLWLKMSKEAFEQTLSLEIYADGVLVHELTEFPKSEVKVANIQDSASDQRLIRLPGLKGRNITFKFRVNSGKTISFDALSLEWKLGKMRG